MTRSNALSSTRDGESSQGSSASAESVACTVAALTATLGRSGTAFAATESLLIYPDVSVKQRTFQNSLGAGRPEVTTTAVGRSADFERALRDAPDAVLIRRANAGWRGLRPSALGQVDKVLEQ